jgi:hypothetical protein
MSILRIAALTLLVSIAASLPASAQEHWAVGKWVGNLGGLPSTNRFGTERTLEIKSVANGTAQGIWNYAGGTAQTVTAAISGNDMSFTTAGSSGAIYKLTHKSGALDGSWSPTSGKAGGSVNMKKQ